MTLAKKFLFFILGFLILTSCLDQKIREKRAFPALNTNQDSSLKKPDLESNENSSAGPTDGSIENPTNEILQKGKQEIRHIIDPFDGTYKTKVSLPKNFQGLLSISGLNITSLKNKLTSVRFRFGREREEVIIPASIGRAPGIVPDTEIEVLILDMQDQPFRNMRLLYDLFDYTDYDTNKDQIEWGIGDAHEGPVSDPRASGIYCRGLKLEDDPTFQMSSGNNQCDSSGERCLYAYAKIKDSGLYYTKQSDKIAFNPQYPALAIHKEGYAQDSFDENLKKCLPDTHHRISNQTLLQTPLSGSNPSLIAYGNVTQTTQTYEYRGPFRTLDRFNWEIKGDALLSDVATGAKGSGLFQKTISNTPASTNEDPNLKGEGGIKSFLFPRSGQMKLKANVEYLGFGDLSTPSRSLKTLISPGETEFMDGCNIRVSHYDSSTNESIHSCTVSASIDLIYEENGTTKTLASSKTVKLQLIRPSLTNYLGRETLYTSLKNCKNNQACASDQCCFNNRCWGKELVSQCSDDTSEEGNRAIGTSCSSDLQCTSLCCSSSTGTCSVHNLGLNRLCSKSPGQSCISRDFCRKENIPTCFVVKTGFDTRHRPTCALRCYHVPTLGECRNGVCQPPPPAPVPDFDPSEEGACDEAIDPPTQF